MDSDVKLLAVYEDLLRKIEEVMKMEGPPGQDGQDGLSAPDSTGRVFAMMATMHSDLLKKLISAEREVTFNPQITVQNSNSAYSFDVERDNRGLINRVQANPIVSSTI